MSFLNLLLSNQVQRSRELVHSGPRLTAQQEMVGCDYWQKNRCKSHWKTLRNNAPSPRKKSALKSWSYSLQLVNMIEAIKELADALVPSGKLIEMVDIALVSAVFSSPTSLIYTFFFFFKLHLKCFWLNPLQCFTAFNGGHTSKPVQWRNQRNRSCFRGSSW